ncbi:MAG: lytic transglycosylase domain-containing protein [Methylomonas sp.]|jgi:membrane-bound lytic murein transglycosylase D|uniref:lytic transglycosylase domain-containing protein n=1 Tax=Methylomonas sp. TaxID=418 RepID=UPI0025EAC848|nr:lytic transglycosylase domain-containing protein [Methylomonas sp.]MCK9605948.1 lytic transglycosylase domain-containing protein [Methylomonas sp.]
MNRQFLKVSFFPVLLIMLNGCSTSQTNYKRDKAIPYRANISHAPNQARNNIAPASYTGLFPKPAALEPAVDFWRKTYAVWRRSEVAYHDDRFMDVVYEVMPLPGYVAEGLTTEQKMAMSSRRDFWKSRLSELENKLRYNAALNADDRQLIAKLESSGRPLNSILPGAGDRVRAQRGTRERFKRGLEISGKYNLQFRKVFRDAGLPEELAYLPHVESSFQPSARSSAGAVGMWQFTKAAAQTFMPGNNRVDQRLDPFISANGAANYLSYAYRKLGNWPAALTSYNHGIGGMNRAQNRMGTDFVRIVEQYDGPAFGFASRNYYAQFLAAREIASNPEPYFREGIFYETPIHPGQYLAAE